MTAVVSVGARRSAPRLLIWQGIFWFLGNALTSGTLVSYLFQDLGASGTQLSLLLAAPALASLLRLLTPTWLSHCGSYKPAALRCYAVSYALLGLLPTVVAWGVSDDNRDAARLTLLGLIAVHQLLESVGHVVFWSWLAELIPQRVRGRFLARRQFWQLVPLPVVLFLAGSYADLWRASPTPTAKFWAYGGPVGVGVVLLAVSTWLLSRLPDVACPRLDSPRSFSFAPLRSANFRRWLFWCCAASAANGLTQTAQNIYPRGVLRLGLTENFAFRTAMQCGQAALSLRVGRWCDRWGNVPVLAVCQVLTGSGLTFYLLATPQAPHLLLGAWLLWSAFAGVNVARPNLTLGVVPSTDRPAAVALVNGCSDAAYAVATLGGGLLFDALSAWSWTPVAGGPQLDRFALFFFVGTLLRVALGPLLLIVREPPPAGTAIRRVPCDAKA